MMNSSNRTGGDGTQRLQLAQESVKAVVPFLGLIFICVFFQFVSGGKLLSAANLKTFANYAFQVLVPACGAVFLMSQGNLDYSMAGNVCVSAALGAMLSHRSIPLAIAVMLLASIAMGAVNAGACVYLGVPSFIATLASSFVYTGLASVLLGGGALTANFAFKKADTLAAKYGAILVVLLIAFVVFNYTSFGKYCRALGAKQEVVHQSGVNVQWERILPFLISGLSCGVVAIFTLVRTCSAATSSGAGTQINTMLALLLGGIPFSGGWSSRFRAVVVGGLIMAVVTNGLILINMSAEMQQLIKGIIFVIAVALSFDRKNTAVIK
jgi:ribose transport system permease protein